MKQRTEKRLARAIHRKICARLDEPRWNKVDVYPAPRTFKRSRLYHHIDAEICAGHRENVCAERRFPSWEDHLASLDKSRVRAQTHTPAPGATRRKKKEDNKRPGATAPFGLDRPLRWLSIWAVIDLRDER